MTEQEYYLRDSLVRARAALSFHLGRPDDRRNDKVVARCAARVESLEAELRERGYND